ncbi:hypothetical protein FF1_028099 [Malus domestica]|uniref:Uncharacterized protein n=1 Tax=Malus domestica TaxID=3750 RepID=A0A498KGT0_MALDO|nr:hypothetical protein DVH24_006232 [Malus domestica]
MKIDDSDRSSSHDIVLGNEQFDHILSFPTNLFNRIGGMVDVRVSFTAVQRESLRDSGLFPYSSTIAFTNFQEHIKFPQNISRELGISFSHNMDDEYKKLIHRITPPSCIHNCPREYNKRSIFPLEAPQVRNKSVIQLHSWHITLERSIFHWKHLKLGTSLLSNYIHGI